MDERYKLVRNIIACKKCADIIESRSTHEFVMCTCGAVGTDGGLEYQQVTGYPKDMDCSHTIYRNIETNELVSAGELEASRK